MKFLPVFLAMLALAASQAGAQPGPKQLNATALKASITMKNKTLYVPSLNLSSPVTARQVQVLDVGSTADKLKEYVLTKFLQLIAGNSPVPLVICSGEFALCAASTCNLTGANITLNSGVVKPEVVCRCPILKGPAIADLSAGNMQGSCEAPAGKVWSLFFPRFNYPQEASGFSNNPKKNNAIIQRCDASLMQGYNAANCFSFICEREAGNQIATCKCPIGQSPANTTFLTEAGQGDPQACFQSPVSIPIG